MVKTDSNDWSMWCNHVLLELERLDHEVVESNRKALRAWVLALAIQAQLFLGGMALGYLIKMVVDHITKG